jgi:DNA-binding PadR family transcriptional regulator
MMVLRTLLAGLSNGYQIAKTIEDLSDLVLQVDRGSLYPALHRLEKKGWLGSKWVTSETNRTRDGLSTRSMSMERLE